jgi:hypothetical protein
MVDWPDRDNPGVVPQWSERALLCRSAGGQLCWRLARQKASRWQCLRSAFDRQQIDQFFRGGVLKTLSSGSSNSAIIART